jgi:nucleotide-binding universal stress UspA family protein
MNAIAPKETRFKHILFCTDFSERADAAFDFAVDAAVRRPGSLLYILHVIHEVEAQFWKSYLYEVDNVEDQAKKAIDAKITATYRSRVPAGVNVKVEVRTGPDADEILDFAEKNQIDLIVMSRQGRSGVRKTLFGNVTEKITRKAQCAVLVIPLSYVQSAQ